MHSLYITKKLGVLNVLERVEFFKCQSLLAVTDLFAICPVHSVLPAVSGKHISRISRKVAPILRDIPCICDLLRIQDYEL